MSTTSPDITTKHLTSTLIDCTTIVIGSDPNLSNDVKLHRSGSDSLEFVTGNDPTADGIENSTSRANRVSLLAKDIVVGSSSNASYNIKMHRAGPTELQFVPEDDPTPEGSISLTPAIVLDMVPPGAVLPFAGSVIPLGWLLCDGALVATTAYPRLFAVMGYSYGGSGANFNLPNLIIIAIRYSNEKHLNFTPPSFIVIECFIASSLRSS